MKKITLFFVAILSSFTIMAQYSFPVDTNVYTTTGPAPVVVVPVNDAGNAAGVPAGIYSQFTVTADWSDPGTGDPWSSEEALNFVTTAGTTLIDPPTSGGANTGASTTLTFSGIMAGPYDPSVDGFLELGLFRSYTSDSDLTNITVTIFPAPPAPPLCASTPTPVDGGTISGVGGATTISWVADTTGEPADSFDVYFGTTSGALTLIGNSTVESANITGLAYATTYYWYIVPKNGAGEATGCDVEWSFMTGAAPPVPTNDTCGTAISISCDMFVVGNTADAAATNTGGNASADLWYVYSNPVLEDVTLTLCASAYDTFIRVYTDCPATTQIASNDDACGTRSVVTFTNDGTSTYYIMVEGYAANEGVFELSVTCDVNIPAPANDNCDASQALVIGDATSGTTAGATDQSTGPDDDTTCDPFDFHADVWYSVTLTGGPQNLTVTTTIPGGSTSTEAGLAIYPAECDFLDASSLGCAGADSPTGGSIVLTNVADGTYYVRVWSDGVAARYNQRIEGDFEIIATTSALSTVEFENELAFTYYPNPVKNTLTLKGANAIQNVAIYNMLGQEVIRTSPNTLNSEVDMSNLQPGTYFVQVMVDNATKTIKVIKQ